MSWSIGIIENTLEVPEECGPKLFEIGVEDYFYDESEVLDEGKLCFNDDNREHMDYLWNTEIQAVLTEAKVSGRVVFASVEGDNRGTWWSHTFVDGVYNINRGKIVDLIPV